MYSEIKYGIRGFILSDCSRFTILQDPVGSKPRFAMRYKVKRSPRDSNTFFVYTLNTSHKEMIYHGYIKVNNGGYRYLKAKTKKFESPEEYNQKAVSALLWVLQRAECLPSAVHILVNSGNSY